MKKKHIHKYTFKDKKGRTIQLPADLTIEDLVIRGILPKLSPKGTPLWDNDYRHVD